MWDQKWALKTGPQKKQKSSPIGDWILDLKINSLVLLPTELSGKVTIITDAKVDNPLVESNHRPHHDYQMQQSGVRGTGGASISIYRVWAKMSQLDSTGNHIGISKEGFRRFKSCLTRRGSVDHTGVVFVVILHRKREVPGLNVLFIWLYPSFWERDTGNRVI